MDDSNKSNPKYKMHIRQDKTEGVKPETEIATFLRSASIPGVFVA